MAYFFQLIVLMLHLMNSMPEHVKSNVEKNAGEGKLTIFRNDKYL